MQSDKAIYLGTLKQSVYYYVLPKSKQGTVLLNLPRIIFSAIATWIDSREPARIILEDSGIHFSLYNAAVYVDNVISNRYGAMSHDLSITCTDIVRGIHKETL